MNLDAFRLALVILALVCAIAMPPRTWTHFDDRLREPRKRVTRARRQIKRAAGTTE
jgi:hypothetical protein